MITESQHEGIDLIERIRQQDERALTELYERYGQRVYNMAMHVLRHEAAAEEITQDIFFELWRKPDSWNPAKGRLISWLLTATRYRAIDRLRKEQRRPVMDAVSLDDLANLLGSRETVGDSQRDNGELLRKLLKELPDDQRQVINLAFFQGMTHSEIAEHLNLPLGTVKGRVRLGLEKLKEGWLLANR
jgi:RNA polymerase sigma-70 factor (ECF subfamily)